MLDQCIHCAQLRNGHVDVFPCKRKEGHDFKPLSRSTVAQALGSTGGRPPTYRTEEARRAARKASQDRYNKKRRS